MTIKHFIILLTLLVVMLTTLSCSSTGYNTQKGAAMGAAIGALAGQAVFRNTLGTVAGTAAGALVGSIFGNAVDQNVIYQRMNSSQRSQPGTSSYFYDVESPPGEWVTVPGCWSGGRWVPAHRVWVPVNPR